MTAGVDTNYHIDILRPLVETAGEVCGTNYDPPATTAAASAASLTTSACTLLSMRTCCQAPTAKYDIRRLLPGLLTAIRWGFATRFFQLVPKVAELMRSPYPELGDTIERVRSE